MQGTHQGMGTPARPCNASGSAGSTCPAAHARASPASAAPAAAASMTATAASAAAPRSSSRRTAMARPRPLSRHAMPVAHTRKTRRHGARAHSLCAVLTDPRTSNSMAARLKDSPSRVWAQTSWQCVGQDCCPGSQRTAACPALCATRCLPQRSRAPGITPTSTGASFQAGVQGVPALGASACQRRTCQVTLCHVTSCPLTTGPQGRTPCKPLSSLRPFM
jgi:hypothetical protein